MTMTGYESTVLTSIIMDELAERAMRHPDFSRYAYDLTDLARQMRYAARIRQGDLGSADVSAIRECPAYTLLYKFSPKDTGQSKVK